MSNFSKKQINIITLILIQLAFNGAFVSDQIFKDFFSFGVIDPWSAFLINIVFTIISVYLISENVKLIKKEKRLNDLERQEKHKEDLSTIIGTLKHDVANQITIIDGLYQLGKRKEALGYSNKMIKGFDNLGKVLRLSVPEISSLIINKMNEANNYGIETFVEIIDGENTESPKCSLEKLTRIIGNLLDNAIYALKEKENGNNFLKLKVASNLTFFEVENSGMIESEIQAKIFNKGFTTKGDKGNGLGLYIVKSLAEQMNGRINFFSEDNITRFSVEFRKIS